MKKETIYKLFFLLLFFVLFFTIILSDEIYQKYKFIRHDKVSPDYCDILYTFDKNVIDDFNRPDTDSLCNEWFQYSRSIIRSNTLVMISNGYKTPIISKRVGNLDSFELIFDFRIPENTANIRVDFNAPNKYTARSNSFLLGTNNHWANIEVMNGNDWNHIIFDTVDEDVWYHVKVKYFAPFLSLKYWKFEGEEPDYLWSGEIPHAEGEYLIFRLDQRVWYDHSALYIDNIILEMI